MKKVGALWVSAAMAVAVLGVSSARGGSPEKARGMTPSPPGAAALKNVDIARPADGAGVGEWREYARLRRAAADAARRDAAQAARAAVGAARDRAEWERKFEKARETPVMLMSEREVRESRLAELEEERGALARRLAVLEGLSVGAMSSSGRDVGGGAPLPVDRSHCALGWPFEDCLFPESGAFHVDAAVLDKDELCRGVDWRGVVTRRGYERAALDQAAFSRRAAELRDQLRRLDHGGGDPRGRAARSEEAWCEATWEVGAGVVRLAAPGADALRSAPLPKSAREAFGEAYDALDDFLSELTSAPPAERRKRLATGAALARDAARKAEIMCAAAPHSLPAACSVSEAIAKAASAFEHGAAVVAASRDAPRKPSWRPPMTYIVDAAGLAAAFDPYAAPSEWSRSLRQRRDVFVQAQHAFARLVLALRVDVDAREFLAAELGEAEHGLCRARRAITLYRTARRTGPGEER